MGGKMRARDLISKKFVRVGNGHSAGELLGVFFDQQSWTLRELVVVVLDADGKFSGLVEPRDILCGLGTELTAAGEDAAALLAAIGRGLQLTAGEVARRDIPAARPDDALVDLLCLAARCEASALPVFDGKELLGVVPVARIFEAICRLALSEGGAELPFMDARKADG